MSNVNENKHRDFVIARIDEETEKEKKVEVFVSPYGGTKTKNITTYPNMSGEGRIKPDRKEENKEINKYSPERIPSFFRREGEAGINSTNIADLRGDKVDRETALEINRRRYGLNYQEFIETNDAPKVQKDVINKPLVFEEQVEYKEENQNNQYNQNSQSSKNYYNENKYDDYNKKDVNFVPYEEEKNYHQREQVKPNDYERENRTFGRYNEEESIDKQSTYKEPVKENKIYDVPKEYNQTKSKQKKYVFPPIEILNRNGLSRNNENSEIQYQISAINKVLDDFKIGGKVVTYTKGPTVTQFEVRLDPGVNVSKITTINKNLQMELKSQSIRIEAPIPGKSTIGIEAPNMKNDIVYFGDLIYEDLEHIKKLGKSRNQGHPLDVFLGLSIDGRPIHTDIAQMPHGLIAGTSGSGKTVCMYSIIFSMLYKATPDEVKLILIDPKRNELMFFEDIPHLATPIIDDPKLATATVKWCADEMDRRYEFLRANRKREITDYNEYAKQNGLKTIPYIVIIIDEFSDLITMAGDSFEDNVKRLTAKARSAGIHLLIATQRPSTDVIKGTIKANIQCRIAFAVKNFIDSQTILDHGGAENLLGKGDMLFVQGKHDVRVQGAFVSQKELDAISDYFHNQNYEPNYMFTHEDIKKQAEQQENQNSDPAYDPRFEEIARFVFRQRKASANQIQTIFEIGFNRANKIIIALAQLGIVSSENIPGKAREVLIDDPEELERILSELNY